MNQTGLISQCVRHQELESCDHEAFDRVLEKHAIAVRMFVRSLLPGSESADDLAQEALLKIWEKRDEYSCGTNFKAWAFQIARYLVLNYQRKRARREFVPLDDELADNLDRLCAASELNLHREYDALIQCLTLLSESDRALLRARYEIGESVENYAKATQVAPGTIKARLFRLRGSLRRLVESRLEEEIETAAQLQMAGSI